MGSTTEKVLGSLPGSYTGSKRYGDTPVGRDEGRDNNNSSLSSVDEQVEADSSESLLQYEELRELTLSSIITRVYKTLAVPNITSQA